MNYKGNNRCNIGIENDICYGLSIQTVEVFNLNEGGVLGIMEAFAKAQLNRLILL